MFLMLLGFFLSYCYSFRFVLLLLKGMGGLRRGYSRSFMLISLISILGTLIKFGGLGILRESSGLLRFWSFVMLLIQISGCCVG